MQAELPLPDLQRWTPRAVYQTHSELAGKLTFQQAMTVPALAICLRNEALARNAGRPRNKN